MENETALGRWKRYHQEEQEERAVVQFAGVKHVKFGVPTPPNSGSELTGRKSAFAAMLQSTVGSKRIFSEHQDLVFHMNSNSSESVDLRSARNSSVCLVREFVVRGLRQCWA